MTTERCFCPVCPGLSMGTAVFMDGVVVASSIAISDLVHRQMDPDNSNMGGAFGVHIVVAFAIIVVLRMFLYSTVWYGRGSLADRNTIKPPGFRDFFDCPPGATINDCYAEWYTTLDPDTYTKTSTRELLADERF